MTKLIKNGLAALALTAVATPVLAAQLETMEQKFSYAVGYQFAQQLKAQDVKVDGAAFAAAIDDVLQGRKTQLTPEQMSAAIQAGREELAKQRQEKADKALAAGKRFLEQNSKKEGVVVLPSGLQYKVLKAGTGAQPAEGESVTVNYRGTLIDGTEFDSSYARGEPATFSLGGVIPGFREGISKMKTGGKWQLFIPSELGYGPRGAGDAIGPNEVLVFEVELLSTQPAK